MHARPVIKMLWPRWRLNSAARRRIVEHVTAFSLAGLQELARSRRERRAASANARATIKSL
jgi:hypothetical protein